MENSGRKSAARGQNTLFRAQGEPAAHVHLCSKVAVDQLCLFTAAISALALSPWSRHDWARLITQRYCLVCLFSFDVSESRGTISRYPCLHSQMMQITWYWTSTWCCKWKRILEVLGRLRILCMWGEWNNYNQRVDGVEGENKKW